MLGAHLWGIHGVFGGRLVTDLLVGTIGIVRVSRALRSAEAAERPVADPVPSRDPTT